MGQMFCLWRHHNHASIIISSAFCFHLHWSQVWVAKISDEHWCYSLLWSAGWKSVETKGSCNCKAESWKCQSNGCNWSYWVLQQYPTSSTPQPLQGELSTSIPHCPWTHCSKIGDWATQCHILFSNYITSEIASICWIGTKTLEHYWFTHWY